MRRRRYYYLLAIMLPIITTFYLFRELEFYLKFRDKLFDNKLTENLIISVKDRLISHEIPPTVKLLKRNEFKIFNSDEWIFNFNVSQMTSLLIKETDKQYEIETLVLLNYPKISSTNYMKRYIKCMVLMKNKSPKPLKPKKIFKIKNQLFKFTFIVKTKKSDDVLGVSVIDEKYFTHYSSLFDKSRYLLSFQKPFVYDKPNQRKEIANCVHMVNIQNGDNIRYKRLLDWIDIQYKLGYKKLKFYIYKMDEKQLDNLSNYGVAKYGEKNLIEIQNYKINYQKLCEWSIQLLKFDSTKNLFKFLYDSCRESYKLNFDESKMSSRSELYIIHELLCTNDCFNKFKREYELITNCDFDEFIFPRLKSTNDFDMIKRYNENKCDDLDLNITNKYNIYNYAHKLLDFYGKDTEEKIAFLHFENVVFFYEPLEFIKNIHSNIMQNRQVFRYQLNKDMFVNFESMNINTDFIQFLKKLLPLVECYNKTYDTKKFDYKWNNFIGAKSRNVGKSIFLSKYVDVIIQHYGIKMEKETNRFDVAINDGYVTHFREEFPYLVLKETQHVDILKFDFEYYLYYLGLSNLMKNSL